MQFDSVYVMITITWFSYTNNYTMFRIDLCQFRVKILTLNLLKLH